MKAKTFIDQVEVQVRSGRGGDGTLVIRFTETDPCGSVRTLEGKDETGAILFVR